MAFEIEGDGVGSGEVPRFDLVIFPDARVHPPHDIVVPLREVCQKRQRENALVFQGR